MPYLAKIFQEHYKIVAFGWNSPKIVLWIEALFSELKHVSRWTEGLDVFSAQTENSKYSDILDTDNGAKITLLPCQSSFIGTFSSLFNEKCTAVFSMWV